MTIRISNVYKSYKDNGSSVGVLCNLSFAVDKSTIAVVLGASGCGKSTLLRIIARTEKPDAGSIYVNKATVGIVFQHDNCLPWLNVRDNVSFGLLGSPTGYEESVSAVNDALVNVGLSDMQDQLSARLSGGQKQRVAFARLLASKKQVWLLDEPFSALDVRTRNQMQTVVREAASVHNTSVLLVTHDILEALVLADSIYVLSSCPASLEFVVSNVSQVRENPGTFNDATRYLRENVGAHRPSAIPSSLSEYFRSSLNGV
jgi:ABC-type nitrate/sulfonate/bicarbonate transport system ATPase subunit